MAKSPRPKLEILPARLDHIDEIIALSTKVYPEEPPYTRGQISGQINNFPDGAFVALYEGVVVGYAASTIVRERQVPRGCCRGQAARAWAR